MLTLIFLKTDVNDVTLFIIMHAIIFLLISILLKTDVKVMMLNLYFLVVLFMCLSLNIYSLCASGDTSSVVSIYKQQTKC